MEVVQTKEGGLVLSQSLHIKDVQGRLKTHLHDRARNSMGMRLQWITKSDLTKTELHICDSSLNSRIVRKAWSSVGLKFHIER